MARGRRAGERTAGPRGLAAGGVKTRRAPLSPRGRRGGGGGGSLGAWLPPGPAVSGVPRRPRRGSPRTARRLCWALRSPGAGFPDSAPPPARLAPSRPALRPLGSETPGRAGLHAPRRERGRGRAGREGCRQLAGVGLRGLRVGPDGRFCGCFPIVWGAVAWPGSRSLRTRPGGPATPPESNSKRRRHFEGMASSEGDFCHA